MSLKGKTLFITGASRGIGRAAAMALHRLGAHVVAVARAPGGLAQLAGEMAADGALLTTATVDISDAGAIEGLSRAIQQRHGRLDVFVSNAAAVGPVLPLSAIDLKAWTETITANVTANFQLIRCFEPLLLCADAPRAVFVTSAAATLAGARRGPYASSKAALDCLARVWASEMADTQLKINLFSPGPVRTEMRASIFPDEDPMTLDTPEQVAEKLIPLCLPDCSVSGQIYDYKTKRMLEIRKYY